MHVTPHMRQCLCCCTGASCRAAGWACRASQLHANIHTSTPRAVLRMENTHPYVILHMRHTRDASNELVLVPEHMLRQPHADNLQHAQEQLAKLRARRLERCCI